MLKRLIISCFLCSSIIYLKADNDTDCFDGSLLFREDFGGNSIEDPLVCQTPLTSMSNRYKQNKDVSFGSMAAGKYTIVKSGYANGDTINSYSQWHIQDDHTYPNDYNRGYFLEIDGMGGEDTFYELTMDGLCTDIELTFSAWITNVHIYGHEQWLLNQGRTIVDPNLTFVIYDAQSGIEIARYDTGEIQPDAELPNINDWIKSNTWNRYALKFSLPNGSHSARMKIINHATNGVGNDFAIDDIEVRLCGTKPEITIPDKICINKNLQLKAHYPSAPEGTIYRWLYSPTGEIKKESDWRVLTDTNDPFYTIQKFSESDNGFYRVAVADANNIDREYCRNVSDPLYLQNEDCPCTNVADTITLIGCDSIPYQEKIYRTNGFFKLDSLRLPTGCDSLSFLNIRLYHSVSQTIQASICDDEEYDFNGEQISKKGTYSQLFQTSNLCDSVIVLLLDVHECNKSEEQPPTIPCGDGTGKVYPESYFTPNNDSVHDLWEIHNINCYQHEVYIFDRYGKKLCEWHNNFDGWDGTYRGIPQPSTDYWYYIKLTPHEEILTGHFTLIR